jgi:predicted transcriptional regulator
MTRHALTVEADQSVAAAAVVMCEGGVNRVPVIDQKHHVAGILTRDDVVAAVARAHERASGRDDASLHSRMGPD